MIINLEIRINLEILILIWNFQVGNINISLETSILTWEHHYQVETSLITWKHHC